MKKVISTTLDRFAYKMSKRSERIRITRLREKLASIHPTALLEYPLKVTNARCVHIGAQTRISWGGWFCAMTSYQEQQFEPEIRIGNNCYIGNNAHIVATRRVIIGDHVMLADRVFLSDNLHEYRDVSRTIIDNGLICCGEVHIGDESWIGDHACIIGNIRIGRHCVIGANAVVLHDLPDYSVAVGVPAKIIKRYNETTRRWEATDAEGRFLADGEGKSNRATIPDTGTPVSGDAG